MRRLTKSSLKYKFSLSKRGYRIFHFGFIIWKSPKNYRTGFNTAEERHALCQTMLYSIIYPTISRDALFTFSPHLCLGTSMLKSTT